MAYPVIPDLGKLVEGIKLYAQLKHERGSSGIQPILTRTETALREVIGELEALQEDAELARREANDLPSIRALRPDGPRKLWDAWFGSLHLRLTMRPGILPNFDRLFRVYAHAD